MSLLDKAKEQAQDLVDKAKQAAGRFAGEHAGDHSVARETDGNGEQLLRPAPADRITDAAQDARDKYLGH